MGWLLRSALHCEDEGHGLGGDHECGADGEPSGCGGRRRRRWKDEARAAAAAAARRLIAASECVRSHCSAACPSVCLPVGRSVGLSGVTCIAAVSRFVPPD
eukprot:COSAG02_NODE_1960_length_10257_cov_48.153278_10_plen_101_part_00